MRIEAEHFPLIVVRWQGTVSEAELARFFSTMDELADRAAQARCHYAVVSEGDAAFSAMQRKQLADWTATFPEARAQWDLGNYVVLKSAAARNVLTAVRWLSPRLSKVYVFASFDEALGAARRKLDGVTPRP